MSIVSRCRPTCRCRDWWSSTRRPWPRRPSTSPGGLRPPAPARLEALGITAQRASAIVWDGRTGAPIGPGLGWQDLRTAGTCLELQAEGLRYSPTESATKFAWLLIRPTRPTRRQGERQARHG